MPTFKKGIPPVCQFPMVRDETRQDRAKSLFVTKTASGFVAFIALRRCGKGSGRGERLARWCYPFQTESLPSVTDRPNPRFSLLVLSPKFSSNKGRKLSEGLLAELEVVGTSRDIASQTKCTEHLKLRLAPLALV